MIITKLCHCQSATWRVSNILLGSLSVSSFGTPRKWDKPSASFESFTMFTFIPVILGSNARILQQMWHQMHLHHQNSTLKTQSLIYYKCASQHFNFSSYTILIMSGLIPRLSTWRYVQPIASTRHRQLSIDICSWAQAEASSSCRSMGKIDRRTDGETPDH